MRSAISGSLFRRLAAGVYDIFLIFALLLFATAIALLINHGNSFKQHSVLFSLYLISAVGVFYCWFWTHGGQTLGMQAWKIKAVNHDLSALTWPLAIKRFVFSVPSVGIFGVGYLIVFCNRSKLSLHDWASKTRIITQID